MNSLITFLEGKKTYLACALGLVLIGAYQNHWITISQDQLQQLTDGILLVALAALRASK